MTQEYLKSILDYDKDRGVFTRRHTRGRFKAGTEIDPSLNKKRKSYPFIKIDNKQYGMHQLAWLYENGELIIGHNNEDGFVIDHIDGDVQNNRIDNLRKITLAENSRNRTISKNNKYGSQGIDFKEKTNRWVANIRFNYEFIYLGSYLTKDEAIAARQGAERALGFHENHGRNKK